MTTLMTAPDFPLYSIALTDWLPKVGEKAFLAWLNFHAWKDSSGASEPSVLPLPITQVIKRLKVGNSTFYNQILRPLWNYGLIEVEKIPGTNQFSILVHLVPQSQLEKANQPISQIRDYDQDWASSTTAKPESHEENNETMSHDTILEEVPTEDLPLQNKSSTSDPSPIQHPLHESDDRTSSSLPPDVEEAISLDPRLLECKPDLENAYRKCRHHPHYSDMGFLAKVRECLPYRPHVENFAAYLYKAMLNEWNRPFSAKPTPSSPSSPSSPSPPRLPPRPPDVPEWVWKQQHEPPKPFMSFSPEQQAIADRLLHEISLLGRCEHEPSSL